MMKQLTTILLTATIVLSGVLLPGCVKVKPENIKNAAIFKSQVRNKTCLNGKAEATIIKSYKGQYLVEVKCYDEIVPYKLRLTHRYICENGFWRVICIRG